MKYLLFTISLGVVSVAGGAEDTGAVRGAEITETGIYRGEVIKTFDDPNIVGGKWKGLDSFTLIEATTNVPARLGITFGFRYEISGTPTNAPIVLTMIGEHPPLTDPKTGKTQSRDVYQIQTGIRESYMAFCLDEAWKTVPGEWRFEIWHKDRKLCEQAFVLVSDAQAEPEKKRPSKSAK